MLPCFGMSHPFVCGRVFLFAEKVEEKVMKKLLSLILVLALTVSLTACSGQNGTSSASSSSSGSSSVSQESSAPVQKPTVDPSGAEVKIPDEIETIGVLSPAVAEVLVALGCGDQIVVYDAQRLKVWKAFRPACRCSICFSPIWNSLRPCCRMCCLFPT